MSGPGGPAPPRLGATAGEFGLPDVSEV